MHAVVVYESMYGNTATIAEAIADGLRGHNARLDVTTLRVGAADPSAVEHADLIVVGGPTHTFGMSRMKTRAAAVEAAQKPDSGLRLEPGAAGPGVREWLPTLDHSAWAAAFDTSVKGFTVFGHASRGIAALLRRRGLQLVARPETFLVTKDNVLRAGEIDRARAWGRVLAAHVLVQAGPGQ